jgi:PTS system nitrogen regulatory IIA component
MGFLRKKGKQPTSTSTPAVPPAKALYVGDFLLPERIIFFNPETSKAEVLDKMVKSLPYAQQKSALNAILEREKIGSTLITPGLAIPHGRLVDVPDIMPAIGICPQGIEDPVSKDKIRLFLLFIGPANYMKRNLDFLAAISALFQTEGLLDSLLQLTTSDAVLAKIKEVEKQ